MKFHLYRGESSEQLLPDVSESEEVKVHGGVKRIPQECFMYWDNLQTVHLPEGLQVIEQGAFAYCTLMRKVHIPFSVKVLQDMAFVDCSGLTTVWLSDAIQVLEQSLFENCVSLKDVHMPLALKTIKESCFASCKSLRSLLLPYGLQRIGDWAMTRCESMTSLTLPATVTHVGRYCFQQCTQLLSLEFPIGLSYLGDHCFVDCSNLRSMVLPEAFEFAGSYPLLDRSLLKMSFQDVQSDSYEDESLVRLLNHRFESLPIHDACYHLSQHYDQTMEFDSSSTTTNSTGLKHLEALLKLYNKTHKVNLEAWISGGVVDGFGMNPLHLLSLSGVPNAKAFQLLLEYAAGINNHHQAAYRMLHCQDIFGATPLAYLCRNHHQPPPGNKKLCEQLFDSIVTKRLAHMGLNEWKQDIGKAVSCALEQWDQEDDDTGQQSYHDRLELVGRVFFALEYHERKESSSLLECWLWKLEMNLYSLALYNQEDRQQCRIHCGAEIVIRNVLSFLPPLEEDKYLKDFTTNAATTRL